MKLETKQTEVRLIAESDIDKFYLENFFKTNKRLYLSKDYEFGTDETFSVTLTHQKQE